jgi:hypothetical protein
MFHGFGPAVDGVGRPIPKTPIKGLPKQARQRPGSKYT